MMQSARSQVGLEPALDLVPDFVPEPLPPHAVSSATQLAAAREDSGLTQQELADFLRLDVRQVLAIELGDWDRLPGRAFARAAVRAIARVIKVDPTPLLETIGQTPAAEQLVAHLKPIKAVPVATAGMFGSARLGNTTALGRGIGTGSVGRFGSLPLRRIAWPLAGLAGLAITGMAFSGASGSSQARVGSSTVVKIALPGSDNTVKATIPSGTSFQAHRIQTSASASASEAIAPSIGRPVRRIISTSGTAGAPVTAVATTQVAPVQMVAAVPQLEVVQGGKGPDRDAASAAAAPSAEPKVAQPKALKFPIQMPEFEIVELGFSKPTWVDIRHKNGEKLLFGTQKANKSLQIRGVPPMQVVIGNPDGVKMQFRGKTVDIHSKARKGVSKFVLN